MDDVPPDPRAALAPHGGQPPGGAVEPHDAKPGPALTQGADRPFAATTGTLALRNSAPS